MERTIKTESLTKAVYHLRIAGEYLEDCLRSAEGKVKTKSYQWNSRVKWVLNDVYQNITPESRERFKEEIMEGDFLFGVSISEKWIRMTDDQRTMLETMADAMLKGEEIIVEK